MAKVYRLKRLAKEREYTGDAYGARKLRNTANIILAHVGNLPCVNHHICPL
jgi:transcriptional regulator of NAD metabolism